jgi:hypothetical protein
MAGSYITSRQLLFIKHSQVPSTASWKAYQVECHVGSILYFFGSSVAHLIRHSGILDVTMLHRHCDFLQYWHWSKPPLTDSATPSRLSYPSHCQQGTAILVGTHTWSWKHTVHALSLQIAPVQSVPIGDHLSSIVSPHSVSSGLVLISLRHIDSKVGKWWDLYLKSLFS